jgi:cytochrome c5
MPLISHFSSMRLWLQLSLVLVLAACSQASEPDLANAHPGQGIYNEACISCHNPGISGAPRLGDVDAWQPRAAKGRDALVLSTINGLNAMPAKGMCWRCTDEDLGHAVDYMLEQAGLGAQR